MIRLLMLDFDTRLVSAVTRTLQQQGVAVVGVQNVEHARRHAASKTFDVAVLDADLIEPSELESFASLPLVLVSSFLPPEGHFHALPNARVLRKPFTTAELLSLLREAFGPLSSEPMRLVDVLRLANTEGRSVALQVGRGEVHLENGELVHAELDGESGESALAEVLARAGETLVTIPSREVERTIHRPFQVVLLDLLHFIEQRERGHASLPLERRTRPSRGGSN